MILRKNISLTEEYLKKLEPLIEKHNGNLSAVIREVIDLADAAFVDPDSVKRLISGLKKEQNLTSSTLVWALKNLAGRLPDEETVNNIIGSSVSSISSLEKRLNEMGGEIYWGLSVKSASNNDMKPDNAVFTITGKNMDLNRYLASVIALYVAKNYHLGVTKIRSVNNSFEIELVKGEDDRALGSVTENFGYLEGAFSELYKKPDFWSIIIGLYIKMNYDMVAISRQSFEGLLGGKISPKATICIERFCDYPINQIPSDDFLKKIASLYPRMGIIKNVDINKESLIIHHGLTEPLAIRKLADMFVELLSLNGRTYSATISENLIIMKMQPEVGKILTRMIEDLKPKETPLANYHNDLLKLLDMLKNVPSDEEFIKSFGSKFGKKMIQNYETDKKIDKWDAGTFIKYLQETNAVLGQDANWANISENVIHGEIRACRLVNNNGNAGITNCMFIKGIFNSWVSHAFGDLSKTVYESQGKNPCEIYIALKGD